jgi:hypothetical protein
MSFREAAACMRGVERTRLSPDGTSDLTNVHVLLSTGPEKGEELTDSVVPAAVTCFQSCCVTYSEL